MKKPEWLFVGAMLLVGAYFSYRYFSKSEKFNSLQLVPNSSVAVYETKNISEVFKSLQKSAYWQDLNEVSELKAVGAVIKSIDSLLNKDKRIARSFKNNNTLVSLHVTGNESAGLMLYLPTGADSRKILNVALQKFTGLPVIHQVSEYDKLTIHELSSGEIQLTYLFHESYAIVSTVGYLVEDVVRNINDSFKANFLSHNTELINLPKLTNDNGNLYLNGDQITSFYHTLLPALHKPVGSLAKSIFMDINLTKDQAFFSGFLFEENDLEFAALFKDQEAGFPTTIKLVPDNAALVMSINVSDVSGWHKKWITRFQEKSSQGISELSKRFTINILGDITLAEFNSNDKTKKDKLLLIKLSDKEGMLNMLNKQAEDIATQNNDSVYFENYSEYKIGLIDKSEFVSELLGSPFSGFSSTYFMIYDDYLILSSSPERIKKWLNDLDDDYVWGRSAEVSSFIDENLGEISFALVFNNPWNWGLTLASFNSKHQRWWQINEKTIKQFAMASYQFTNLDNRFYTAASVKYQPLKIESGLQTMNDEWTSQLAYGLIKKPKLVRNHTDGSWEVFLQDSTNQISLLNERGEILWQDSLSNPIVSNIYQVDNFKNRKLQYLFATDSAIYMIDRNGNNVENFPYQFSDFKIEHLYLLDYDHSKKYRFLMADNTGNLRMFNQQMEPLEGWNPLAFNSALSNQTFHVRVRGKDRILVANQNGIIDLRNRRAEEQNGFPLDLQFNINNPIHFAVGSTFEAAKFTTISKEGMVMQFDLNGRVYGKDQLYQPTGSSEFSLVIDAAQNDFVITRQDLNRLTLLNKEGGEIFSKDYQTNGKKDIQYYSLGVDKQLFIIRDLDTRKVYLYNKDGILFNSDDIFSDYALSVVYKKSNSKCYIYTAEGQSIEAKHFSF